MIWAYQQISNDAPPSTLDPVCQDWKKSDLLTLQFWSGCKANISLGSSLQRSAKCWSQFIPIQISNALIYILDTTFE